MQSVGDMARALVLRTNQVRLRTEMDKLAVEVATGLVKDRAKHLGGDITGLTAIDRTLSRLNAYRINTTEAALVTGTMQQSLGNIQDASTNLAQNILGAELTPSSGLLDSMSADAEATINTVFSALNQTVAGRFVFSGTATDRPAVVDPETMMTAVRGATTGKTTFADISAEVDLFFAPGGLFDTTIYTGSGDGIAPFQIGEGETAQADIRATEQPLRDILKPIVMAALARDASLDPSVRVDLLRESGATIVGAQESFTTLRAGLGATEARIEDGMAQNAAERTATSMAKLDLIEAEPYETAARYESVRAQLESIYAITVRSQRLSLTEFIR
ncbi:flagellin [Citreimonas salinaria]|uniref:Flagellar hook-associated protein 3 FlgL n=1 Tax=Citreimonas salinaria TaxID=321339 RepID=A0A1H3FDY0_9RHOB|nr:flagellin [Citreimonas salinaria]SDX89191.1 flagellar hook-associated protein 3 FlgL [Citreimonas salinaria]